MTARGWLHIVVINFTPSSLLHTTEVSYSLNAYSLTIKCSWAFLCFEDFHIFFCWSKYCYLWMIHSTTRLHSTEQDTGISTWWNEKNSWSYDCCGWRSRRQSVFQSVSFWTIRYRGPETRTSGSQGGNCYHHWSNRQDLIKPIPLEGVRWRCCWLMCVLGLSWASFRVYTESVSGVGFLIITVWEDPVINKWLLH